MTKALFLLSIIIFLIKLAQSFTTFQYEIKDLEGNDSSSLALEAASWGFTSTTTKIIQCGNYWILGGSQITTYGTMFTRTYTALPAHNTIQFSLSVWVLDVQSNKDLFTIYFDTQSISKWDTSTSIISYPGIQNVCAGSSPDLPAVNLQATVPHSLQSVTVKILSHTYGLGGSGLSFGVRDLNLLFKTSTPPPPSSSLCKFNSVLDLMTPSCLCQDGYYDPLGPLGCTQCNAVCKTCINGNGAGDCTDCKDGYYFDGTACSLCHSTCSQCSGPNRNQCITCIPGRFLYSDGNCRRNCYAPNVQDFSGITPLCKAPSSSCPSPQFSYQNNTCLSTCAPPFIQGANQACNFPCNSSSFFNWDGQCQSSCDYPLVQSIKGVERYCSLPCDSTDFLFENDTCQSSCPSPNFIQINPGNGIQYCNFSCPSGSFLNWDDQCQNSCDSPFVQSLPSSIERYCSLPCDSTDYLYQNGTCQSSCLSPNFVEIDLGNSIQYCNFSCPSGSFKNWQGQCQDSCNYPYVQTLKGVERYCSLPCDSTDYFYQNGTCQSSCPSHTFIEIDIGSIQYCNFSCPSYLYWNHTCQDLCEAPFISISQGVEQYCELPCSSQEFLYENGTCLETCNSPFVIHIHEQDGYSTCEKPCESSWFLYWNDVCLPECPLTFQNNRNGVMTCDFFCSDNLYHYPNNTCQTECIYPFVQSVDNEGFRYCQKPCDEGKYLYENGSCISDCNYQISTDSNSVSYCTYPCDFNQFLYENGTCSQFCPGPYLKKTSADGLHLCNVPCAEDFFYRTELEECVSHCSYPLVVKQIGLLITCQNMAIDDPPSSNNTTDQNDTSILNNIGETFAQLGAAFSSFASKASAASSWIRPNNKNSAFMISLAKSTKHIQLINFSPIEGRILQESISTTDSEETTTGFSITNMFTYKMPQNFKEQFQSRPVPLAFRQNVKSASFVVNMWESLTSFFSLIFLGIFSIVCGFIAKKTQKQTFILLTQKLKTLFRWNFVLFVLFNSYDDITFYTIIEFQTLELNSAPAILSFLTCLLVVSMAGFMLYKVLKITKESLQSHKKVADVATTDHSFSIKYSSYQVLHSGYENSSFLKQGFLFISTCKTILCYLIIGCLYKFPMAQTSLLTVFSLLMMAYLLKEKPTCDRFHLLIMLLFEVLGLMTNICMFALAVLTNQNSTHIATEKKLIKTILVCNLASELATSVVLWIYVFIAIHTAWRKTKEGAPAKITWLNVLVSPFQAPGMEFCEENEMGETVVFRGRKRVLRGRWRRMPAKIAPAKLSSPEIFSQSIIDLKTTPSLSQIFLKDSGLPTLKKTISSQTNEKTPKGQKPFISLESEVNGNLPESDPESLDGYTTSPSIVASSLTGFMSPTSQEGLKLDYPKSTPDISRRTTPKRLTKHDRNKPSTSSVQKYLPSVIIEELSPSLPELKQDVSIMIETPINNGSLLKQLQTIKTLKFDEDPTPKNMLLKSRCFDHHKKNFDNVIQEITLGDNNGEDYTIKEEVGLSNTFSKAMRTWKKTNTVKQDQSFALNDSSNNLNLSDLSLNLENFQRSKRRNLTGSSIQRKELLARSQMNTARTFLTPQSSARLSDLTFTPQQSERRGGAKDS